MKKFTRTKEDFICGHCAFAVEGNGFTNHCPKCLWSKHVDVNPGDRSAVCKGMMEPVESILEHGEYSVLHRCILCGFERKNKVIPADDFQVLVELSKKQK